VFREALIRARTDLSSYGLDSNELLLSKVSDGSTLQHRPNILHQRDANWRIKIDGICPGTSCSEGRIDNYGNPAPVPDSRCSLCRFHLTGPRFLIGNVLLITEILRRVHSRRSTYATADCSKELIARKQSGEDLLQGEITSLKATIEPARNAEAGFTGPRRAQRDGRGVASTDAR